MRPVIAVSMGKSENNVVGLALHGKLLSLSSCDQTATWNSKNDLDGLALHGNLLSLSSCDQNATWNSCKCGEIRK